MRPGTPGFVGARLTEAREARGITITALSELVHVSRQSITQYEKGEQTPGPETLTRLAMALAVPAHYFLKPLPTIDDGTVFFRSMSAATKSARKRATVYLGRLYEIAAEVEEYVELPPVDIPRIDIPVDPLKIEQEQIEDIAVKVRRAWSLGDGPISNIVWLMENHGIVVSRLSLDAETLDGLSRWINGRPYVLLTTDVSAARSRFDAAHELGHLLLHRHVSQKQLNSSELFKFFESQAHRFAAAFAFPATAFAREAYPLRLDHFVSLKSRWRLSIKMMISRARDLRLITEDQAAGMYRSYSYRKWHGCEPLDDVLPAEQPRLLDKAMQTLIDGEACTPDGLAYTIGLEEREIVRVAGVARGRLSTQPAPVHELKFRLRALDQPHDPDGPQKGGGVVVAFPRRATANDIED
jgi:Zn-dependent peptidase ImmA (M78 family)/transcriptional regulator with XRE-family HTH domain